MRYIPKEKEIFYYISDTGHINNDIRKNFIGHRIKSGNCYRTEQDTERARDRQYALVELMDFYNEYSGEERTLFDLVFNLEVNDEFVNLAKEKLGEEKLKLIMEV